MDTKQNSSRKNLGRSCWVRTGAGEIHDAVLVDVSQSGAKVTLPRPVAVPGHVDLLLTRDGKVGRRAKVEWKTDSELGLRFEGRTIAPLAKSECEPGDGVRAIEGDDAPAIEVVKL